MPTCSLLPGLIVTISIRAPSFPDILHRYESESKEAHVCRDPQETNAREAMRNKQKKKYRMNCLGDDPKASLSVPRVHARSTSNPTTRLG